MFNINSPTVQQMLKDLPEGMGNMQFYNGNPPTITHEEYPISQEEFEKGNIVPLPNPSPKEMITESQQVYNTNPYQAPAYQPQYNPYQAPMYQPQYNPYQVPMYQAQSNQYAPAYQPQYNPYQAPMYQPQQPQYNPYQGNQYYQPQMMQNAYYPQNYNNTCGYQYTAQRQAELMKYMKPWRLLNPFDSPMAAAYISQMQAAYTSQEETMSYLDIWQQQEDAYYRSNNSSYSPYLLRQYAPPTYVKPFVFDPNKKYNPITGEGYEIEVSKKPHFRNFREVAKNVCRMYPQADEYFRDATAKGVPFENQLESMVSYCKILIEISYRYNGKSDEEIEAYEKELFDPDPYPVEKNNYDLMYNSDPEEIPVYESHYDPEAKVVTLTLVTDKKKIVKTVTERRYRRPIYDEAYNLRVENARIQRIQRQNYLYDISPERQFDHVPLAEMIANNYMGQVGVYYERAENKINSAKLLSRIYDHDLFMDRLKRDTSNKSEFGEKIVGRFYGRYGVMPDGRPTDPTSNPEVAKSFSIDPQTGMLYVEAPTDFSAFDPDRPENKEREEMLKKINEANQNDPLAGVTVNPPNVVGRYKEKLKEQFYNSIFVKSSPVRGD